MRLWDGRELPAETLDAPFTLVIHDRHFFSSLLLGKASSKSLGEAYVAGWFDVEGDLTAAIALADVFIAANGTGWQRLASMGQLLKTTAVAAWQGRHAFRSGLARQERARTREAISFHYDLPVEFWQLWLDPRLLYTCGYFPTPEATQAQAQTAKLEMICRKLGLRAGEHLLDIGCGWGGLMCYAARHYGVRATGITLSQRQAEYARALIVCEGLEALCRVEVRDFREMQETACFDKITGVGVIEHVGEEQLDYFRRAWTLLRPGGRFFNQGITTTACEEIRPGDSFIDAYVFPDARLLPISRTLGHAEDAGFEVRDVESLREHYTRTSALWRAALEANETAIRDVVGETTFRVFRLYLAGFTSEFQRGRLNLHQTLLVKSAGGASQMPLHRSAWYAAPLVGD